MPPATIPERLASLEAHHAHLEEKLDKLDEKTDRIQGTVDKVLEFMNQAKGGWKAFILMATIGGAVGATLTKLAAFWLEKK